MKTLHTIYSTFAKHNMAKFLTVLTILFTVGVGQMWGTEVTLWEGSNNTYQASTTSKTSSDGAIKWVNDASNTYSNPTRLYSGNTLTISVANANTTKITKIVATCTSSAYASAFGGTSVTVTGGGSATTTATTSSPYTTTISITGKATSVAIKMSAQSRVSKLTVTYETAAATKYTVNWHVNSTIEHTQTDVAGTTLTNIPTPTTADCDNSKVFVGWTTESSYSNATTAPSGMITNTSGMTMPEGGGNYYAVFATSEDGGTDYLQITSKNDLVAGGKYLIVGNSGSTYKALPVGKAESLTSVTPSSSKISNPATELVWTLEGSTDKWKIKSTSNDKYLQISSGSLTFETSTTLTFSVSVSSSKFTFTSSASSGNKILSYYHNGNKFNAYTTANTVYLYKQGITYSDYTTSCTTETTITLNPNGGTISDTDWILENGVYKLTTEDGSIALPTITRTGYTFGGWATSSGGTIEHNANATITLDGTPVTLYAIWTANTYNITYKDQGNVAFSGTHEDGHPIQHTYGIATTLKGATKIGYTFEGWYKDAACTNKVTTLGAIEYTGNITLYAKWTEKALTNYRTFCDVVCDAYSFHTGSDDDRAKWLKEAIKCFTKEGGYEHEWQIKDYIIPNDDNFFVGNYGYFYNDNLGIGGANGKSRSVVSDWGNMYLAPAMDENDASGSPRLGHAKGAKGTLRIFDDSNWDNLYVGFIPDGYKLMFGDEEYSLAKTTGTEYRSDVVQYNSTNADKNVSVGVVDADGKYVATNHTQEMRHIFLKDNCGWHNDGAKLAIYYWGVSEGWCGFLKTVPGDETLFEGWIPSNASYLKFVRYNSNQSNPGSWDYENDIWNSTGDLTIDGNLFTITDWGTGTWSTYEKYGQFAMHDNSKSKNWYVHFVPHYVLTYDKNADDATGEMDIQTLAVDADDKKVIVADCGFTRPGYRFIKWRKGTTSTYYVPNGSNSIELNADITLYAVWEKEYTVTYNANGGTTTCEDNNAYIKGETVTVCDKVPTKTGHTFMGWSDGTNTYSAGATFTMPANDVTLTAQWQINQYTVTLNPNYPAGKTGTFIDNHGNTVNQVQLTYDYNTPSMPLTDLYQSIELDGYQFDGWFSATVGGSPWTQTGDIKKNVTVYAQWTKVYSVILSENGTTKELDPQTSTSYTLPTELSVGSCDNDEKELVGWSTVAIPTPGDKPTSDFYELGATVTLSADQTTFYAVFATTGEGESIMTEETATLSFEDVTRRTSFSSSQQVWEQNGIIFTNNKANSSTDIGNYANPVRCYKSSEIIIDCNDLGNITKVQFRCYSSEYASNLANSMQEATSSDTWVTLIPKSKPNIYEITLTAGQTRIYTLTVTYEKISDNASSVSYSDYTTACAAIPDPVWGGAEIDQTTIHVDCGSMTKLNAATPNGPATISFPTATNHTLTYGITVTASEGFLVSTNKTDATKYGESVTVTPNKTGENAGKITQNVYVVAVAPAMSDEDFTGTITLSGKQLAENQVIDVTADVTCTTYTLTLDDRGTKTTAEYYAGASVPKPADPEGVCTDPINYVFDGWSLDPVTDENTTSYEKVTFPFDMPAEKKTLYAVYRYLEGGGNGDYNLVTSALDDWSGDYLIAYSDKIFANGTIGGESGIGAKNNKVDLSSNISNNTIPATVGDQYNVTLEAVTGGYVLKTQDGKYNYHTNNTGNGISASTIGYADDYPISVDFVSQEEINLCLGGNAIGSEFRYNTDGYFRFYKNGGQQPIYLYKKADGTTYYTTSPVCGPHLVITEGKDIYVTGGNAGGTRDLVIAQTKVSYKATRLNVGPTSQVPDVKVATNGITVGGVVTSDVKVTIDQNKEQQTDGTYTITGTITVQYQPSANNKQEDIQVQLAVDYNTDAKDNFTVHARSLPSEFVIVAKSGDKWYALNGDMNNGSSANPANGQVTLDDDANPTKATYAPCNTIYTFDGVPNTGDRTRVRFQGTDGAWLWAASGTNVGIQNKSLKDTPEGDNKAYNWKLETEDNITYKFHNDNSSRLLGLSGEKFGMYASAVQELRILPYVEKCLYNYAPSNLIVKELKGSYVVLTWDAVVGATKYQYSTDATTWTDAGTEPTVTINGLTGDTEYTYYIRAYHEDAGVSQECIDYAEITFTTADCDDVPTNITYTADLNSITMSWTAAAPTATIKLFMNEDGTGGGGTYPGATSPYTISGGLNKNTTYYIQILSDGTCASPIIPVKTEDVEVDIVEWGPQSIIVDINTNEDVEVILENEVSYGTGLGTEATELFFSKYYEASYNVKLVAIYNGTKNIIDLTDYTIQYGKTSWESNYITLKDFGETKGQIQPGEEIILYSMQDGTQDDDIMDCVHDAFPDGNWVRVTSSNNTGKGTLSFGGDKTIILCKTEYDDETDEYYDNIIDVIGALKDDPNDGILPTNENTEKPSWGDKEGWICETGVSIADDSQLGISTNRCLLIRNNTVTSGENAVAQNVGDFVTLCSEWKGAQVPDSDVDNGVAASCENFAYVGTFDYSDYYTKYVPMDGGIVKNDENQNNNRNADGTLTISIPDLYKHACSNIRIKYTNGDKTEVLADREYKVPIMITSDQTTAGQAFLELQENLATVEVDGNGNVINTYPLTLDEVREICKTCDVVIRDDATLTKASDNAPNDHPQVNNVMIYEGASLEIPSGEDYNYTINSLSLRRKGDDVASAKVEEGGNLSLPTSATAPIYLDMRIDANNWHWFTLPYNCNIADVTWVDGTPAQYNKDWFIMYYDGNSRAHEESIYENHWRVYNGTTIEAGKGYIVGIQGDITHPDYTFELRFPMTTDVLTNEHIDKTVAVNAWGVDMDITPNKKGWNLVGNPYLDYYKTSENISFKGLSLIKYGSIDSVTGDRLYDSGNIPFLVSPVDGGWYEYKQELASEVEMNPFTAYFVQVGDPANENHTDGMELHAEFVSDHRGRMSLIRRAPQEVDGEQEPVIVRVEVANAKGESDKTTLIVDDRFTNDYEMNGDFFKWFGDYYRYYTKPVLYSMGADQGKRAFNALSEQLASQPVALGMFAAQAGEYTFSLTRKRCDLSRVEEVWLYDATSATYTNLMQQDYTFTTAKTEGEGRFYLSVKMKQKTPTAVENVNGNLSLVAHQQTLVLSGLPAEAQVWVYDATGKLLHGEHTTAYQRIYPVQQAGVYFVSVKGQGDAQTLSTIVK